MAKNRGFEVLHLAIAGPIPEPAAPKATGSGHRRLWEPPAVGAVPGTLPAAFVSCHSFRLTRFIWKSLGKRVRAKIPLRVRFKEPEGRAGS